MRGPDSKPCAAPAAREGGPAGKRCRANSDFLLRDIAGDAILVPVGEAAAQINGMVSLNVTFRFLWEFFQQPHTMREAVLAAAERFNGPPDEMEQDISDSIEEMLQYGFINEEEL